MTDGEQRPPGGMESFRRLGDSALGALQTRIELFSVELAEEKRWLLATLVWTVAGIFFLGVAVLTITATIVVLSSPRARPLVLIVFCLLYSIAAAVAIMKARNQAKERDLPFSGTVGELKKDLAALRSRQ